MGARIRPDGELWYAISTSSSPREIRAGSRLLLQPPGPRAPEGTAYTDLDVGRVHAFLAEPAGPRPHPTIFRVHGGPAGYDGDVFSPEAQAWVDHGFAVTLVNYRGSAGYGKAWRDAIVGNPGFTELEDLAAVRDQLIADGIADAARMVLAGPSWGGYLTLLGLGVQPERWSLGIAAVPIADLVANYEDQLEPLKAYMRALFGGTPEELPDLYRERSPLSHAEKVRAPVLILAGLNDPRCPSRQMENYVDRLTELGTAHEVYRYDAGHGTLVIDEQIQQLELQLDFAARHLGTQAPL